MICKKWIVAKDFSGTITEENLKLVEYELPVDLKLGGNKFV